MRFMSETVLVREDGRIALAGDPGLPEVLDVLVVGGGPAGTAAAFRAKETGLSVLVIDSDDILKRIRDYSKDKPILPDFGPVDNMKFVHAGELVNSLHFGPVDKDAMHALWKSYYVRYGVPAQVGTELIGLDGDGPLWRAKVYNYNKKAEESFAARHVVLALGRGVPRRFDIPGNCDGIAFRLSDPALYTGRPSLVIGGGTSSAEAVIAISNAKKKRDDPTEVHWSYRGARLPRVSRALAEPFFEAYLGNGNVRYWPNSEPVAVVTGDDKVEYLSIRVDRRTLSGRPSETSHLEFRKEDCIACIGEDVPYAFLEALGIRSISNTPGGKKRIVISSLMESERPNVFLIGDTLSDKYVRAERFEDPSSYQEVARPGNIKAGLRDGVFVIEAIQQRLARKDPVVVNLQFAGDPPAEEAGTKALRKLGKEVDIQAPPAEAMEPAGSDSAVVAYLVRVLPGVGDEQRYPIHRNRVTTMGRKGSDASFPEDTYLSDSHASIAHGSDGFMLRDDSSETGVFLALKAAAPREISSGGLIRAGRQFVSFQISEGKAVAEHHSITGARVSRRELGTEELIWGRTGPDVIMDAQDMSLSKRHFSASCRDGKVYVTDLMSTNGTYVKVSPAAAITDGDEFRIGQQRFRLAVRATDEKTLASLESRVVVSMTPAKPGAPAAPAPAPVAPRECRVTFASLGKEVVTAPGTLLLDLMEDQGIEIEAVCRGGACGSDAITVLAGAENLSAAGEVEKRTLKKLCKAEPPGTRLACMAAVNGPVTVELRGS
jgi:thioredoxin reductase/ferredoxin